MTNISISEINSYLKCKRAWDLTSPNRQSLKHKATPKIYLTVGSAVHAAIEAQANGDDPYEYLEEYIQVERADKRETYQDLVGSAAWDSEMEEFESAAHLAMGLVRQYMDHYSEENPLADQGLKYVATEVPFSIPLGGGTNFVGTFDGIATDLASETKFYLTENKTAGRKPNLDMVERSNQFLGYNWAFKALTGRKPAGTLYNLIMKRLISAPKTLKSGALSVDKSASVTLKSFQKALNEGNYDPIKYIDYLRMLAEREQFGDDRFFHRQIFTYTEKQLDNWASQVLYPIARDIQSINDLENDYDHPISDELDILPNYNSCEQCFVVDICKAMDHDLDVDRVVSERYKVGKSPTSEAVSGATPVVVQSADELISYLKEIKNA